MADGRKIELELTPDQYERLLALQPDAAKLPELARELVSRALREGMDHIPGRKTKPVPEGRE